MPADPGSAVVMAVAGAVIIGMLFEVNRGIGGGLLILVILALLGKAVQKGQLTS